MSAPEVTKGQPTDWPIGTIVRNLDVVDGHDISRQLIVVGHTAKRVRVQWWGSEVRSLAEPEVLLDGRPALWLADHYWTVER